MNLKGKKVLIPIILGVLLIVIAIGGYIFAKKACVANIEEQYKEELQALKEIADYDDIDCNPFSKSVSIKNIKAKDGKLFIKELVFSKLNEDKELNIPLSMSIKAKGVKAKDENGEIQEGDVDLSYKLDLKKEEMDFSMGVSVKNEGKYKIDILFGDIDRDTLKILNESMKDKNLQNKKPEENLDLIMTLGKISIKKFKFSFEDMGIIKKILEDDAKKRGLTVEDVKKELVADIEKTLQDKTLPEDTKKFLVAFKELIEGKRKRLSFTLIKNEGTDTSIMKIFSAIILSPDPVKEFNKMFTVKVD